VADAAVTTASIGAIGRQRRNKYHGEGALVVANSQGIPPQKRVKGGKANGILKAPRSAPRTRQKPVARIPKPRSIMNPRERDVKRRGSLPRIRWEFTFKPCWDQVSSSNER